MTIYNKIDGSLKELFIDFYFSVWFYRNSLSHSAGTVEWGGYTFAEE